MRISARISCAWLAECRANGGRVRCEYPGSAFPPEKEKYILAFVVQGCFSLIREWINSGFDLPSNEITDLIIQLYTASLTINIGMEKMTGGDQR